VFVSSSVAHPNPLAAGLYQVLFVVWIVGEVVIFGRSAWRRDARIRDRGSLIVVLGSVFVGLTLGSALASAVPAADIRQRADAVFLLGLVLMAGGIALRFTAVIVLGRYFTPVVMVGRGQRVVDTGPYRWVRHPSYTGSLLTIAGVLLAMTNWLALLALLPVIAGLLYRIRVEEQALSEQLGDAYRSYMRRTKRLVPFLY
jgi:protein-S-isoprenylcysteine O-methyltransferase Ste14